MSDTPLTRSGCLENIDSFHLDSRPAFLSSRFKNILTELTYGIERRKGLMLLTGDAGTGKSVLVGHLAAWSLQRQSPCALVSDRSLGIGDILDPILKGFAVACSPGMNNNKLFCLNQWLLARYRAGKLPLLILEDAHRLSPRILEQVRLLLNFETPREKLLQVLLVGRPELEEKLKAPALRQLRQRIALRCKTAPFSLEETAAYIEDRLRLAGADRVIFAPEALSAIHAYSRGVPGVANSLCQHAIATAIADSSAAVSVAHISEAARRYELDLAATAEKSKRTPAATLDPALLSSLRQALSMSYGAGKRESGARPARALAQPTAPTKPAEEVRREPQPHYPGITNLHTAPSRPLRARSAPIPASTPAPTPVQASSLKAAVTPAPAAASAASGIAAAARQSPPSSSNARRVVSRHLNSAALISAGRYWTYRCLGFIRDEAERTPARLRATWRKLEPVSRTLRTQAWPRARHAAHSTTARAASHPSVRVALGWLDGPLSAGRFNFLAMKSWKFVQAKTSGAIRHARLDALKVPMPRPAVRLCSKLRHALTRLAAQAGAHPKTRALQRWLLQPLDSPRRRHLRARPYAPAARPPYSRRIGSAQTGGRP